MRGSWPFGNSLRNIILDYGKTIDLSSILLYGDAFIVFCYLKFQKVKFNDFDYDDDDDGYE